MGKRELKYGKIQKAVVQQCFYHKINSMNIYKYCIQTSHLKICINAYLKKLKRKYGLVFLLKERYIIYYSK